MQMTFNYPNNNLASIGGSQEVLGETILEKKNHQSFRKPGMSVFANKGKKNNTVEVTKRLNFDRNNSESGDIVNHLDDRSPIVAKDAWPQQSKEYDMNDV